MAYNGNDFRTFWKVPSEISDACEIRNGWTAIGCGVPPCLGPSHERKQFHAIARHRLYARLSSAHPGPDWLPLLTTSSGLVFLWTDESHSRFLFACDANDAIGDTLTERYKNNDRRATVMQALHRLYYRIRPLVPRAIQMRMKRGYTTVQSRLEYPSWPAETGLQWFLQLLVWTLASASGGVVPHIGFWPGGRRFCAVLTHDVETMVGVGNIERLVEIEKSVGVRSCWNFVPERYPFSANIISELKQDGFEVGVHGLNHDGRLFESRSLFSRRAPKINRYAKAWNAAGFRSPACHRNHDWMASGLLGFAYDSSYPDTDPYQPMPGGCSTVFPWFLGDMVELPITLPQDHVVFDICGGSGAAWRDKLEYIESVGGLALLIVHPDYMLDATRLREYEQFLLHLKARPKVWFALPQEVASWWRFRTSAVLKSSERGTPVVSAPSHPFTAKTLTIDEIQAGAECGEIAVSNSQFQHS